MPPSALRKCKIAACQTMLAAQYSSDFCETHLKQRALDRKCQREAKKSKENSSATQRKRSTPVLPTTRPLGNGNINVENQKGENTHDSSSSDDEVPSKRRKTAVEFANLSSLLGDLHISIEHAERVNKPLIFCGAYSCPSVEITNDREYATEIANTVWKTTKYRFTHNDYRDVKVGISKRMWCCQSIEHVKPPKPSMNPEVRRRDTIGFDRFPCDGTLGIRVLPHPRLNNQHLVILTLKHLKGHVRYLDVSMPPEALAYIKKQLRSTPGLIAAQLVGDFPHLTQPQVYSAWTRLSEAYWKKDEDPIVSVQKLLQEDKHGVDFWELDVPEGVTAITWGCRKISERIGFAIVEIGLDATYNTNEANLELYTVIAEVDNAGYPLAYCLLSTATAISPHKRATSLKSFLTQIQHRYRVNPSFTHVDKDFAEISALGAVWPVAKIQICFWHLKRAITERLSKPGLKTTPYNVAAAREEFAFIDPSFVPTTPADPKDNEEYGYGSDAEYQPRRKPTKQKKPSAASTLPPPLPSQQLSQINPNALRIRVPIPPSFNLPRTQPALSQSTNSIDNDGDFDIEENATRRQFCPLDLREAVTNLIERHYCAHPSIPGYARPDAASIRWWAVEEMYTFCVRNNLRELWAYLWSNWYRPARWVLWARSTCPEIPRLKTTMIVESHWRRVKSDFLSHNHKPRLDYLAWILIKRLMPTYEGLLDWRLTYTGRHRRLPAWRKAFKKEWKRCEVTPISNPDDDTYNPLPYRWVCTCPAFVKSRFLVCKHLVQSVHQVPARFFQQVSRERSCPIWRHPDLCPLNPPAPGDLTELAKSSAGIEVIGLEKRGRDVLGEDDDDGEGSDGGSEIGVEGDGAEDSEVESDEEEAERKDMEKEMQHMAHQLQDLAAVIEYNAQYTDRRALEMFTKKTKAAMSLIKKVQKLEKLVRSHTTPAPPTFSAAYSELMFVRTRPRKLATQI